MEEFNKSIFKVVKKRKEVLGLKQLIIIYNRFKTVATEWIISQMSTFYNLIFIKWFYFNLLQSCQSNHESFKYQHK